MRSTKKRAIDAKNGQKIKKENYESSCVECSVIWFGNVDNGKNEIDRLQAIWNVDMGKNGEDKLERQGDKWTGIRDGKGKEDANRRNKK